jgi:hypothetical protein
MPGVCDWCVEHSSNAGGAHPLAHVVVGDRQLCVDVGIAWAIEVAWRHDIVTTNSCQAWGEWMPDVVSPPWYRRIDVVSDLAAHQLAGLLGLRAYECTSNNWGGTSLTWLPLSDPGFSSSSARTLQD